MTALPGYATPLTRACRTPLCWTPLWADSADLDTDAPISGLGSASWRRARMAEEYLQKKFGSGIQVSAACEPENLLPSSLVLGRGDRVVFLERTSSSGWGYTDDPDIARAGLDAWGNTAETMTTAIAGAIELLENPPAGHRQPRAGTRTREESA